MTRANILTPWQQCAIVCPTRTTFQLYGDVRRCEHGQIWMYRLGWESGYWGRLWPALNPIKYRRAVRALAAVKVTE